MRRASARRTADLRIPRARARPRALVSVDRRNRSAVHARARWEDDLPIDHRRRTRGRIQRGLRRPAHARLRRGARRPRVRHRPGTSRGRADASHSSRGPDRPAHRRSPIARIALSPMADYFVHESSYVDDGAVVGAGTKIWHFCHVMSGARIGSRCNIGQNVVVSPEVVIGDNVKIQNNVSVYTGVILENDVFCGPSMVFTNVINPRSHVSRKDEYRRTLVRRGATLGANCTVVCGHTIGRYAFVGAGTVVTKDVPDFALVLGNPGRLAGWMCKCGVKLTADVTPPRAAQCPTCGSRYACDDGALIER